jgi:hypothetical protein
MTWNESEISILINERRKRNEEYWTLPGNDRTSFWNSIAEKINLEHQTSLTGKQCKDKFQNLVRDYKVRSNLQKLKTDFYKVNIFRFTIFMILQFYN